MRGFPSLACAVALVFVNAFSSAPAVSAVPATLSYQGYLTNAAGEPRDGNFAVTLRLYTVPTGGVPLWSEVKSINVSQGLFNVTFGDTPGLAFPANLFDTPLFLGVVVGGDAEMTPRRALTSAAFAFRADEADLLDGRTATQLDQSAHVANTSNPHSVTAAQTGAATTGALSSHTANASAHHARYTNSEAVAAILAADGTDSGLDADLLDGVQGSFFMSGLNQLTQDVMALQNDIAGLPSVYVPKSGGDFDGTVTVGGRLGVGSSAPSVKLHLRNTDAFTEALRIEGAGSWLAFYTGTTYDGFLWNNSGNIGLGTSHLNSAGSLIMYAYGQERMRVSSSGRVGVNTNNPAYRLHVEDSSIPLYSHSTGSYGMYANSDSHIGIYAYSNAPFSAGVFGQSAYIGVEGITNAGSTDANRQGVRGDNGGSATGWAGYFFGKAGISGVLTKGSGAFKIDHPLDPKNKYLYHSFVESPDMKNIYDGTVVTDDRGFAEVTLPDWFDALNRDFRYQVTVIGQFAQAIISRKIDGNRFQIASNVPNVEVSWQVTGIRKDAFAEKNRIPVEEDKPANERGKYLHPVEYGAPIDAAVDYRGGMRAMVPPDGAVRADAKP